MRDSWNEFERVLLRVPRWAFLVAVVVAAGIGFGVGIGIGIRSCPVHSHTPDPKPETVTCRSLASERGFYGGRLVRVRTVGMRPGPGPNELVYYHLFSMPPTVVCRFTDPIATPLPEYCVGRVEAPPGGPVVVVNCRPD